MRKIIIIAFTLITIPGFTFAQTDQKNCDKEVEVHLENIGNKNSKVYEVIEIQAGVSELENNEIIYKSSNYRLSGYSEKFFVKLAVDAKTCSLLWSQSGCDQLTWAIKSKAYTEVKELLDEGISANCEIDNNKNHSSFLTRKAEAFYSYSNQYSQFLLYALVEKDLELFKLLESYGASLPDSFHFFPRQNPSQFMTPEAFIENQYYPQYFSKDFIDAVKSSQEKKINSLPIINIEFLNYKDEKGNSVKLSFYGKCRHAESNLMPIIPSNPGCFAHVEVPELNINETVEASEIEYSFTTRDRDLTRFDDKSISGYFLGLKNRKTKIYFNCGENKFDLKGTCAISDTNLNY